ncbi:hypothetical protein L873DRAFT_1789620 [Choiromyces venosus 120613-1]|uniref:Uncharacterized protein n=1 Tax=Choiromyces venosus 120613-1 TaxID=1336337 RepID=A0A3N4JMK9_9PEZI|nr:hypothetical protein L873DRAFT_1789620 [Choiromyces venosus 120613-1]
MPNLPAIGHGRQLIQILQQTLQRMQQAMQQQGQQLVKIGQQITCLDHNNFAKLLNSSVNHSDTHLEILHNINNQPVQGSPATGTNVGALSGPQLNTLLVQLSLPVNGTVIEHRKWFIKHIGLRSTLT